MSEQEVSTVSPSCHDVPRLENTGHTPAFLSLEEIPSSNISCHYLCYSAPPAVYFSAEECAANKNRVNRQTRIDAYLQHPCNSVVEYPETGKLLNEAIGHLFNFELESCNVNFFHPKLNIQFSLGDGHGSRNNVQTPFLTSDKTGTPVNCRNEKISCKGLKYCEQYSSMRSDEVLTKRTTAHQEVFLQTLAFFCVLSNKGCAFEVDTDGQGFGDLHGLESEDSELTSSVDEPLRDCRHKASRLTCDGKIVIRYNKYNRPYLQCEHRSGDDMAHLIIRNLDDFDVAYLFALLLNDREAIFREENIALTLGYGPLAPCIFTDSPSAQKELCPFWHRFTDGTLRRGKLIRQEKNCAVIFDIYTPNDLSECPRVFMICKHPHSHPNPFPTKTPPPITHILTEMLMHMTWKLADATPRKIMTDSGFMAALRSHLRWCPTFDPSLADLHPSLGNTDHVRRIIDELQKNVFPLGTGFEGAQLIVEKQKSGPPDEQYVRCAESHLLDDGQTFYLIICMSRSMSAYLMQTEYVSIDTAFKRLHHKWQEFEIESWDAETMRSVVSVRAFTTSQSAQAHLILFTRIFEIATGDTGIPVQFRHIHGVGFSVWIADAHKGQALGVGMYCVTLCADIDSFCMHEPWRKLKSLDPYDHLRRFFRLCLVHFKRHVHDLRPYASKEVRTAMLSIASAEPHPDLEGTFKFIHENGGKKIRAWLNDKLKGSKFAIPALYQPASFIPYLIWKASPSSSNGNEQSHRNINRDGVGLTILGGIMRGMQYDARAQAAREVYQEKGIYSRDQLATHFRRSERAVNRQLLVQQKIAKQSPSPTKRSSTRPAIQMQKEQSRVPPIIEQLETSAFSPSCRSTQELFLFDFGSGNEDSHLEESIHTEKFKSLPDSELEQENDCVYRSLHIPRDQLPPSTYSELTGALVKGPRTSLQHRSWNVQALQSDIQDVTVAAHLSFPAYNKEIHSSLFSSLEGALVPS